MSLANKYRPKEFSDCVEQERVVKILQSMCDAGMPCRNILLTGPAGCGKTTLGRLIAMRLNGNAGDVTEIDAASNNGVDAARDLVTQAKTFPVGAKYKVIIIDETHALTKYAWDALLKVLEESPARTVFVFCTTNPEKIPKTILSRVQTFRLARISVNGIQNRLKHVLDSEISDGADIKYTNGAIQMIAQLACGGLRDSLTLLDKVLSYTNEVTAESVEFALDLHEYDDFFDLLSAISKKDNGRIISVIDKVYSSGVNFSEWFSQFHSFLVNVVRYIYTKNIMSTIIPPHYENKMQNYGQTHALICLRLASVVIRMSAEIKHSSYPTEIALTYLCTSRSDNA